MTTALVYTVLSGNTLSGVAHGIDAASGVSATAIQQANPMLNPNALSIGAVIDIPAAGGGIALHYTILAGNTYTSIAAGLAQCVGVTWQEIASANPGLDPNVLHVGQQLNIPATGTASRPDSGGASGTVPSQGIVGFWRWTWSKSCVPPADANLGLAFSGYTDPGAALSNSAHCLNNPAGTKFITFGGGNSAGSFNAGNLAAITAAIQAGKFKAWVGVAYDVEGGDSGLAGLFSLSFAAAKAAGLQVLVTVSHSQPYDIPDAARLMQAFIADPNIDYLSPQLYTTGSETHNDYTALGTPWSAYATAKAAIVPSIVKSSYYASAASYFAQQGVTLAGFIQWSQLT